MIILCLALLQSLVSFYILSKSQLARGGPDYAHISMAIHSHKLLTSGEGGAGGRFLGYALKTNLHPQLYTLSLGLAFSFLSKIGLKSIDPPLLFTNTIFLFVLLLSTYAVGSLLYDKKVGLLSAVLLSFSPMIFGVTRIALIDFALAAFVSLTFLFLLRTRHFDSLLYSVLTGAAFAAAMLTKEAAVVFILPPFLYYTCVSLRKEGRPRRKTVALIITALLCLVPVAMFYFFNWHVFQAYWEHVTMKGSPDSATFFYLKCFPRYYFGVFFCILSLPLAFSYILNFRKRNIFLALWFLAPFLMLSILPFQWPRFLIPCLPAVFLILAAEAFSPWFSRIKKAYIFVLLAAIFSQYIYFNFFLHAGVKNRPLYAAEGCGLLGISKDTDFEVVEKLSQFFQKDSLPSGQPLKIIFLFDCFKKTHCGLTSNLRLKNVPCSIALLPDVIFLTSCDLTVKLDWEEYLMRANYIVNRFGSFGKDEYLRVVPKPYKMAVQAGMRYFKEVAVFETKTGDTICIYRKITPPLSNGLFSFHVEGD